jgi:DNA-3-methyladenine glycosylase I
MANPIRCGWVSDDPLYLDYHDHEWGIPLYDEQKLFELLILEGAQAGLSWLTVLKKRENYRQLFDNFDYHKIAGYNSKKVESLLNNPSIIRNRLKVAATIANAQAILKLHDKGITLSDFLWQFFDGTPIKNNWSSLKQVPTETEISKLMAKALQKRGFKFVGSTICYAFMQAVGMVNDHTTDCFCYSKQ